MLGVFGIVIIVLVYSIVLKFQNPLEKTYTKLLVGALVLTIIYTIAIIYTWSIM